MQLFRDSYKVPKMANFHFVAFVSQTCGNQASRLSSDGQENSLPEPSMLATYPSLGEDPTAPDGQHPQADQQGLLSCVH